MTRKTQEQWVEEFAEEYGREPNAQELHDWINWDRKPASAVARCKQKTMSKLTHNPKGTPLPANHPFKGAVIVLGARRPVQQPVHNFDPPPLPTWEGPVEVVFSIAEESNAGGNSNCWVERRGDDYILFGNELGPMGEPCSGALSALCSSVAKFGMDYVVIHSRLSVDDFRQACAQIILSNVGHLTVNDI